MVGTIRFIDSDLIIKLYFLVECRNPSPDIDHSVKVMGYSELEPSVIGTTVSLYCPVGMVLNGPNMSTCIEDGIWEPDIREVTCMGEKPFNRIIHVHS